MDWRDYRRRNPFSASGKTWENGLGWKLNSLQSPNDEDELKANHLRKTDLREAVHGKMIQKNNILGLIMRLIPQAKSEVKMVWGKSSG